MAAVIRLADPTDVAAAGRVTKEAYLAAGYLADADPYAAMLADAADRAAHAELWVYVESEQVLGTVTFVQPGTRYAEVSARDEGEFRMLAVSTAAGGRGVGEALVRHCLRRATDLGLRAVVLSTLPQMRPAQRIYERLGFIRTPERDWEPRPGMLLITYRRSVAPPGAALP